jgi:hypothetical protein
MPEQIPDHRKRRDEQHAHDRAAGGGGLGTALLTFPVSPRSFVDLLAIALIFR